MTKNLPLHSGLCNRLFIIAHHYSNAVKDGYKLHIPQEHYQNSELLKYIIENNDVFDKEYNETYESICTTNQFWQSEFFFDVNLIKDLIKFPQNIIDKITEKYGDLSDYVAIHVRRGDYLINGNQYLYYIPDETFYINVYNEFFKDKKIIIVSDDIKWCKNEIQLENAIYAEDNTNVEDLCILSLCKHHICSNSTFSWWGCWLGEREDSINVYPNKFFQRKCFVEESTLLPSRWVKYEFFK